MSWQMLAFYVKYSMPREMMKEKPSIRVAKLERQPGQWNAPQNTQQIYDIPFRQ
jgi:hypothetical protein